MTMHGSCSGETASEPSLSRYRDWMNVITARKVRFPVALTDTNPAPNIERTFLPIVCAAMARASLFWFRRAGESANRAVIAADTVQSASGVNDLRPDIAPWDCSRAPK
jgi:hypothetical protein